MRREITAEDSARFSAAMAQVMEKEQTHEGIGRLSEKKLHLTLKYFYQPDDSFHEQKIGPFVADAVTAAGIVEIQTSNYGNLRRKLEAFAPLVSVTVVCPIPHRKTVTWINTEDGSLSKETKSTKIGNFLEAFWELAHIQDCLLLPNVKFLILLADVRDYRYLNGWGKLKKRGSTRCERVPVALVDSYELGSLTDYLALLPQDLPPVFTRKALVAALGKQVRDPDSVLYVMQKIGALKRVGKQGNSFLYEKTEIQ